MKRPGLRWQLIIEQALREARCALCQRVDCEQRVRHAIVDLVTRFAPTWDGPWHRVPGGHERTGLLAGRAVLLLERHTGRGLVRLRGVERDVCCDHPTARHRKLALLNEARCLLVDQLVEEFEARRERHGLDGGMDVVHGPARARRP
jgi:hypothetical protein